MVLVFSEMMDSFPDSSFLNLNYCEIRQIWLFKHWFKTNKTPLRVENFGACWAMMFPTPLTQSETQIESSLKTFAYMKKARKKFNQTSDQAAIRNAYINNMIYRDIKVWFFIPRFYSVSTLLPTKKIRISCLTPLSCSAYNILGYVQMGTIFHRVTFLTGQQG